MLKRLTTLVFTCAMSLFGYGDVLLWQVNDTTKVDGGDIQLFLVPYSSDEDHFPGARVKLISNDGTSSTILKVWGEDENGNPVEWDGSCGVEPGNWGSGRWETGWVQSETGYNTINPIQNQMSGNTLSYPPEVMEILFVMELGYNTWDDDLGDYVWETLAQSAPELYQDLMRQHMYATGDISPPGYTPWTPDFYTTPEPSTSLLCIIGLGVLMLKRKTDG